MHAMGAPPGRRPGAPRPLAACALAAALVTLASAQDCTVPSFGTGIAAGDSSPCSSGGALAAAAGDDDELLSPRPDMMTMVMMMLMMVAVA